MRHANPESQILSPRSALITGASEGIGLELTRLMAKEGWNLVLVARRGELLAEIAADLIKQHRVNVAVIPADLSRPEATAEIVHKLDEHSVRVDALINNAGFGYDGWFAEQDIRVIERMVEVNVTALMHLTRLLVPGMRERGRGWVMNVASLAGFQSVPYGAVYAATKAFVVSFSGALSAELAGTGVTVTCVCPGVTATGFRRVASDGKHSDYERGAMTAEAVARIGYRAMMKGRPLVVTGTRNALLAFAGRFAPRGLAAKVAMRMMKGRR